MQQIFKEIDTDGSGFIEWKELETFIIMFSKKLGQPVPSEKQNKQLFKLLDENKDGKLSFDEMTDLLEDIVLIVMDEFDNQFMALQYQDIITEKDKLDEVARKLFDEYDENKNGFIEFGELAKFMQAFAEIFNLPKPDLKDVEDALSIIDENNDKKLSFEEMKSTILIFVNAMIKKHENLKN